MDKKWPSPMPEGRELLCGGVRWCTGSGVDDGRDPSSFLATPGEAGSGVFSGEESAAGCWRLFSGACSAVGEKPMGLPGAGRTHRDWWHPLRSPSPARQTARVGQQDPSGWMGRAGTLGAGGNGSCSRCALRVKLRRPAGRFAWGHFSAEAAGFIPGVTLGSSIPSDGRTRGGGRFAQLFWSAPGPTSEGSSC